jgi:hypothetical protein
MALVVEGRPLDLQMSSSPRWNLHMDRLSCREHHSGKVELEPLRVHEAT